MPAHDLLSGESLEYDRPTGELAAYLKRLRLAVEDPTVDEGRFIELLYSPENPLLDPTIMPGRGTVTKAVFANPLYHVMLDLLGRKRVSLGTLDMDKVRQRYSLTVREAASLAGVHESAIRQAIASHRLSSVKDKGRHLLSLDEVKLYKPASVGPTPPLDIVHGDEPGFRFHVKHDGDRIDIRAEGGRRISTLEHWRTLVAIAGPKAKAVFWRIEPGPELNEIRAGEFGVRGRFTVKEKINNTRRAREAFKAAML